MKKMKFLAVTAALLCVVGAMAQPQGGGKRGGQEGKRPSTEQVVEKMTDKMDEQLNLSDDQETKIKALMTEQFKAREAKAEEMKRQAETQRNEAKKERDAYEEKILAVLSDKQKIEYLKMKNDMVEQRGKGKKGEGRPGAPRN